ncbi:hypothetical protein ES703_108282 [subsurface metagenome]
MVLPSEIIDPFGPSVIEISFIPISKKILIIRVFLLSPVNSWASSKFSETTSELEIKIFAQFGAFFIIDMLGAANTIPPLFFVRVIAFSIALQLSSVVKDVHANALILLNSSSLTSEGFNKLLAPL